MAIQYRQTLDRTFHALGDGTRREILAALAKGGTHSAKQLSEPFAAAQPTISKHLKVLEAAGLVQRTVVGRSHRFSLDTGPLDEATQWIELHRQFWLGSLDSLDAFLQQTDEDKYGE